MKNIQVIVLSALCVALPIAQTKCAAEADPAALIASPVDELSQELWAQKPKAQAVEIFDVKGFVQKVEHGELSEAEIRANMNRQNPPAHNNRWRIKNRSTDTPGIAAVRFKKPQVLATLIKLGADLEIPNQEGFTPLMMGAQEGQQETVEMLISAKAVLDYQGSEGRTALMCAAMRRQQATTQALIAAKANLNIQDHYKQTALIRSILAGNKYQSAPVVETLLNANADPNIVDGDGITAYTYATDCIYYPDGEKGVIPRMLIRARARISC